MKDAITRRRVLAGFAASGVASCGRRRPAPGAEPRVTILRSADYGPHLYGEIRRLVTEHEVEVRGKRVVLKPNLVEFDSGAAINTHPIVVHGALEAFRSLGASEVRVAEGPGHRRVTMELAEAAGYFRVISGFEDLFTDLNLDEVAEVRLRRPFSNLESLYLPKTALDCDLLVSLPKMKTHHWVGVTLAMKNLFGLAPGAVYGWPKNLLHWAGIDECIADLHRLFPRQFCIVDGVEGMEGNGPIQGRSKHAGVLVAGSDPVAVDATCCRIMGVDPRKIRYLELTALLGQTEERYVRQTGEPIEKVRTAFELIPEFDAIRLKSVEGA